MVEIQGVELVEGDVSSHFESLVRDAAIVAWDIETSGLDWRLDHVGTCQLYVPGAGTQIIRMNGLRPERLRELLTSEHIRKVFHHAPFDLRFMRYHWKANAQNVACTKILSKIVRPEASSGEHSLKPTLERFLSVSLDKSQQTSNWLTTTFTDEQIAYAARDVQYLVPLLDTLMDEARANGVADIAERTFEYLPIRVETDIRGCGDVFSY